MKPKRIQRKRTKGWVMPEGAVYVGRPTRWGNPFVVNERAAVTNNSLAVASFIEIVKGGSWFSEPLPWPAGMIPGDLTTVQEVRAQLRGKDLACWCPLDQPCHADVLLEIANAEEEQ